MEEAQVSLSLVPGGAARRSPDRATGGVAVCETNSFPGGESPSSVPAADHTISYSYKRVCRDHLVDPVGSPRLLVPRR